MTEQNKEIETPSSEAIEERQSFKKVIAGLRDSIKLKTRDVNTLQDELAEQEALVDQKDRELESERARRIKAESLVAETKKLDQTSREVYKKIFFCCLLKILKFDSKKYLFCGKICEDNCS